MEMIQENLGFYSGFPQGIADGFMIRFKWHFGGGKNHPFHTYFTASHGPVTNLGMNQDDITSPGGAVEWVFKQSWIGVKIDIFVSGETLTQK